MMFPLIILGEGLERMIHFVAYALLYYWRECKLTVFFEGNLAIRKYIHHLFDKNSTLWNSSFKKSKKHIKIHVQFL